MADLIALKDAEIVMKVLIDDECLPPGARQMLVEGLPHAIKVHSEKRHLFQEQFIFVLREALLDISKAAEARQAESRAAVENSKKYVEEGATGHQEAISAYEAAAALVTEKMQEHAKCEAAAHVTRQEHEQLLLAKNNVDERQSELYTLKAEVSSILDGNLHMLLDAGCDNESVLDSTLDAVQQYLKNIDAEPALIAAATRALRCKPESRHAFDKLTVSSVLEVLNAEASRIDALIMQHQPEQDDVTAEQLGLWALCDRESDQEKAASAALADAEMNKKTAAALRDGYLADISVRESAVSKRLCEQVIAEEKFKQVSNALEAVERLVAFSYDAKADTVGSVDVSMADTTGSVDVQMADTGA